MRTHGVRAGHASRLTCTSCRPLCKPIREPRRVFLAPLLGCGLRGGKGASLLGRSTTWRTPRAHTHPFQLDGPR